MPRRPSPSLPMPDSSDEASPAAGAPTPLLIVVHPGSACGSADMNLGRDEADSQRAEMQAFVDQWQGGIVVIDGALSEELGPNSWRRSWREWGESLERALARARERGLLAQRVLGDDGGESELDQMQATAALVAEHGLTPAQTAITLTGAWIDNDGGGCVHSVREVLETLGFTPTIEAAMDLDAVPEAGWEDAEEDALESETAPDTSVPAAPVPRANNRAANASRNTPPQPRTTSLPNTKRPGRRGP